MEKVTCTMFIRVLFLMALSGVFACMREQEKTVPVHLSWRVKEPVPPPAKEPSDSISLAHALLLTLQHHPALQSREDLMQLRQTLRRAAAIGPNPRAELVAENFLGSGPYRHGSNTTWTLQVSSVLELRGKPEARMAVAGSEWGMEVADFAIRRLQVLSQATADFVQVLYLQEKAKHVRKVIGHLEELEKALTKRMELGRDNSLQRRQVQVTLLLARQQLGSLAMQKRSALARLAANWGNPEPKFHSVSGTFPDPKQLPSPGRLHEKLMEHPDAARLKARSEHLRSLVRLEKAMAVPDPEFTLGVRYMAGEDQGTLVGGISLPLMIRDRRKEAQSLLRSRIRLAERELAAHLELKKTEIRRKVDEYTRLAGELEVLENSILPEIESGIALFREGFSLGRFTLLEMLDSKKSLHELQERIMELKSSLQMVIIELEFLTGVNIQ